MAHCQGGKLHPPAGEEACRRRRKARRAARATKVAKAALISGLELALKTWSCNPKARAARRHVFQRGFGIRIGRMTSTATRVIAGTSSRRSSSRFAATSVHEKIDTRQVAAWPGEAGDKTKLTGSSPTAKTMGIVVVAALAIHSRGLFPVADHSDLSAEPVRPASAGSRSI
jgi:hypothetical protein